MTSTKTVGNRFRKRLRDRQQKQETQQSETRKHEPQQPQPQAEPIEGIDSREHRILEILKISLMATGGFFILSNIRPYVDIVSKAIGQWADTGLGILIMGIPGVNLIFGGVGGILVAITAFLLWCALQGLELLPTLMMDSPAFILSTLIRIKQWSRLKEDANDSPLTRRLKARFNSIPEEAIERANVGRAVAYLIDGGICLWFYPPVQGGWVNLPLLAAGAWDYLDWGNIFNAFGTLFAVELVYQAYKLVVSVATNHFANN
ncbi:MAG: hypothetical protein SFY66_19635 [Oculatellaceae cyanobacterium bins.114]|nr:hypothetical protein [Oculatellaceae cyanobacterium bins.114]